MIRACLDSVAQAADSEANVLITGETGTGKELFARAIHENSPRADKNFVVVDCASLPEQLVESALFGHKKGAFTGAEKSASGLIKQADGGTLFLDEVGELTLTLQKAFLRVLQERRFRPVGSNKEVESNFRLEAATNRRLDQMVKKGQFRNDLLYRLQGVNIELPPLRERPEDIEELVVQYMTKICRSYGSEIKGISPDFFEALCAYKWPGNVRELISTLEGAVSEARHEPTLFVKHLPTYIRIHIARASADKRPKDHLIKSSKKSASPLSIPPRYRDFRESVLAEAEKKYLQNLIAFTHGSVKKACQISGLGRTRLYTLMKKNRISRYGWPSSGIAS
jgi:two-component system NtrC family response regulator